MIGQETFARTEYFPLRVKSHALQGDNIKQRVVLLDDG
jgi:hypothetical protein